MGAGEPLGRDEVHVHHLRPESVSDPELLERCRRLLSEEERTRQDRFALPQLRHDFLVAHALVRTSLSRYAAVAPERWRFETNACGRPELAGPRPRPPLRFSLSHTRGRVACAIVLERDVGLDVEPLDRRVADLDVAERFFSAVEARALRAVSEPERRARFVAYWTLKEAFVKARGLGLTQRLSAFTLTIEGETARIAFEPEIPDDARSWQLVLLPLPPDHLMALAVRKGDAAPLRVRLAEGVL